MSQKTLTGSIALTKLIHAKFVSKKGANCIMIPIDANFLEKDEQGGVYLPVRILVKDEVDQYGQNGFIAKSIGSKAYKAADEAQKKSWKDNEKEITPILGSIKDFSAPTKNANTGAVSSQEFKDEYDLPF